MKKYYDKILFLLGLAVLGIGAGIFYYKGGLSQSTPLPLMKLTGSAYDVLPPPKIEDVSADWDSPPDQGDDRDESGWIYSIFTPPKIWWDPGVGWTAVPPSGVEKLVPFGIELTKVSKELYRIQLLGTIGNGDANDIIDFSDEDTGYSDLRLRVGEESARAQIKVLSMHVDSVQEPHGVIERVAFVTILDERTNQNIELRSDQEYSPSNNEFYILHVSAPYPEQDWRVTAVGQSLALPDKASFVVTDLDFNKPSVTVEKHSFNRKGKEIIAKRELDLVDESAAPSPSTPAGGPAAKPMSAKSATSAGADPFAQ